MLHQFDSMLPVLSVTTNVLMQRCQSEIVSMAQLLMIVLSLALPDVHLSLDLPTCCSEVHPSSLEGAPGLSPSRDPRCRLSAIWLF